MKKTFYTNQVRNPYCSNGNFMYKHNSDKKLGDIIAKGMKEKYRKWREDDNWRAQMKPLTKEEMERAEKGQETL